MGIKGKMEKWRRFIGTQRYYRRKAERDQAPGTFNAQNLLFASLILSNGITM